MKAEDRELLASAVKKAEIPVQPIRGVRLCNPGPILAAHRKIAERRLDRARAAGPDAYLAELKWQNS